jgi:hypothetical protein
MNGELKMNLRNRLHDHKTVTSIGLACLILANLSRWFLHPTARFGENLVDGTNGFLLGISIGCLLLGILMNVRVRKGEKPCP